VQLTQQAAVAVAHPQLAQMPLFGLAVMAVRVLHLVLAVHL
jgi:hypothetical protein